MQNGLYYIWLRLSAGLLLYTLTETVAWKHARHCHEISGMTVRNLTGLTDTMTGDVTDTRNRAGNLALCALTVDLGASPLYFWVFVGGPDGVSDYGERLQNIRREIKEISIFETTTGG